MRVFVSSGEEGRRARPRFARPASFPGFERPGNEISESGWRRFSARNGRLFGNERRRRDQAGAAMPMPAELCRAARPRPFHAIRRRMVAEAELKRRRQSRVRRDRGLHQRRQNEQRRSKKRAQAFPSCACRRSLEECPGDHGAADVFFVTYVLRFLPFPPDWEGGRRLLAHSCPLLQLRNTAAKVQ